MAILPIVIYNDPVLRQKAKTIESDSEALQKLIDRMFETMYDAEGVGLAAPQVGESVRLFVVDADVLVEDTPEKPFGPMVFINPEITTSGAKTTDVEEGCLSLPDLREKVVRPETITVRFLDRNFAEHQLELKGWMSRVFQHELDHLDGVLFYDYLGSFKQRLIARRLAQIDQGIVETTYTVRPRA